MAAPFILTVLSEDGYQVFAALYREYDTLDRAIEGAKADYLKRYGGSPAFRVYHADGGGRPSGYHHTLIEVCFDESKRRSFVALYKVLQEVEPSPTRLGPIRASITGCVRAFREWLGHLFQGSKGLGTLVVIGSIENRILSDLRSRTSITL